MGKEVTTYLRREVAVDRKIVPFEHVPDHAGGNHPRYVRSIHFARRVLYAASGRLSLAYQR
jgi:hypothetical protein